MKSFTKLAIFALMVTFSVNGYSQTFGIKGGLNLANVKSQIDNKRNKSKMLQGINLGATAEFPITDMFSFETGLSISAKGGKESSTYGGTTTEYKTTLSYLELPLMAKAKFDLSGIKAYGIFGPYLAYGIGGKSKAGSESSTIKWGTDENNDDLKPLDFGLNIGIGVEIDALQIGLTYGIGLANFAVGGTSTYRISNNVIGLSVGYRFVKKAAE